MTTYSNSPKAEYNKESYRKQIARQHSCHKIFDHAGGHCRPCKIFLSSSLIGIQNLVAVSHAVCAHVGPKKFSGHCGSVSGDGGGIAYPYRNTPLAYPYRNTPLLPCYRAEFSCSTSSRIWA